MNALLPSNEFSLLHPIATTHIKCSVHKILQDVASVSSSASSSQNLGWTHLFDVTTASSTVDIPSCTLPPILMLSS